MSHCICGHPNNWSLFNFIHSLIHSMFIICMTGTGFRPWGYSKEHKKDKNTHFMELALERQTKEKIDSLSNGARCTGEKK